MEILWAFMTWQGWQGVAGIAQIVAAVLAIIAVKQAKSMLDQADQQRKDSIAPDWDVVSSRAKHPTLVDGDLVVTAEVELLNTGFGPAREIVASFHPNSGQTPYYSAHGNRASGKVVAPDDLLMVGMNWRASEPMDGWLQIECKTRFGYRLSHRFKVTANAVQAGDEKTSFRFVSD